MYSITVAKTQNSEWEGIGREEKAYCCPATRLLHALGPDLLLVLHWESRYFKYLARTGIAGVSLLLA